MNIVFMGTPDFAVPCLEALINKGHTVSAVFAQPDRPKGRGHKLCPPPVKECAEKHKIPVFQPEKIKNNPEVLETLRSLNPDIAVVVAYGKILPKEMLEIPKFGCINVHASLLPKYRGSAPIQWAVLNGDKVTGVTTMLLDEGMDTGDILLTKEFEIPEQMTSGELFDALSPLGAELLTETVDALESGMIFPKKQDESKATHAPMLSKEMAEIDFSKPAEQIINLIRGMNPWPVAFTAFGDMKIKVYSAKRAGKSSAPAGEVLAGKSLVVSCGDGGSVELCEVQLVGSRRMTSEEMLRGHKISEGSVLGTKED